VDFRRRLLVLYAIPGAALAAIWARSFHVQVLGHGRAVREAAALGQRSRQVMGTRGRVLDADGTTLAEDRTVVRLVFVPAEWATRERFRCGACGAVAFRTTPRWSDRPDRAPAAPRRCTCGAPRETFEALPAEDVGPLEDALRLPPGTLAAAAEDRMEEIDELVEVGVTEAVLGLGSGGIAREARARKLTRAEVLAERAPALEEHEFRVDDLRRILQADWYGRPVALRVFRNPLTGGVLTRKWIETGAEALIEGDAAGRYRGFRAEPAVERWYPEGALIAHAIGYVGEFGDPKARQRYFTERGEKVPSIDVRVGRMGVEAAYEDALRGLPGRVLDERDEEGVFSRRTVVVKPERGQDVRLHLRLRACREAQRLLQEAATMEGYCVDGPPSAGFIAMDAETGAIRAWAETPSFDANENLAAVTDALERADAQEDALQAAPPEDLAVVAVDPGIGWSRVARVAVEPGSSLKILTALALLHSGHAVPESYVCVGPRRSEKDMPGCHVHTDAVGPEEALAQSCNRYFADATTESSWYPLHARLLPEWAAKTGIGQRPPLDYPSRPAGVYRVRPADYALRQMAIGQAVTVTPVQMVRLAALLATGGRLPHPRLAGDVGAHPLLPAAEQVAIDPVALSRVRAGMRGCVTRGTARTVFAQLALPPTVEVYGKTGTATVSGSAWGPAKRRPPPGLTEREFPQHLWFVGYATEGGGRPLAFAVVLHGRWTGMGGDAAAGVAGRFLAWWYGEGSAR
jgi:penicillin-binding protein 2